VVEFPFKALPWYSGPDDVSSSEDLSWPAQTELWWNVHTMPILRRILTAQMGVPEDSDMLRVVNEEFVVEGIHVHDCDETGVKRVCAGNCTTIAWARHVDGSMRMCWAS